MQTTGFADGFVGVAGQGVVRLASKGLTLLVVLTWWPPQIAALSPSPRRADSMTYPRNTEQVLLCQWASLHPLPPNPLQSLCRPEKSPATSLDEHHFYVHFPKLARKPAVDGCWCA